MYRYLLYFTCIRAVSQRTRTVTIPGQYPNRAASIWTSPIIFGIWTMFLWWGMIWGFGFQTGPYRTVRRVEDLKGFLAFRIGASWVTPNWSVPHRTAWYVVIWGLGSASRPVGLGGSCWTLYEVSAVLHRPKLFTKDSDRLRFRDCTHNCEARSGLTHCPQATVH